MLFLLFISFLSFHLFPFPFSFFCAGLGGAIAPVAPMDPPLAHFPKNNLSKPGLNALWTLRGHEHNNNTDWMTMDTLHTQTVGLLWTQKQAIIMVSTSLHPVCIQSVSGHPSVLYFLRGWQMSAARLLCVCSAYLQCPHQASLAYILCPLGIQARFTQGLFWFFRKWVTLTGGFTSGLSWRHLFPLYYRFYAAAVLNLRTLLLLLLF